MRAALGDVSVPTVFRYLKHIPYRRSYNHNGKYYTLYAAEKFNNHGLWHFNDIHFSVDRNLKSTVLRLVREAEAGLTHRELKKIMHVRVHNSLLELCKSKQMIRLKLGGVYVYCYSDPNTQKKQLTSRKNQLAQAKLELDVTDRIVIEVLIVLIRNPNASIPEVIKRLKGHSPPITAEHIQIVYKRYDLDNLGKKGGR